MGRAVRWMGILLVTAAGCAVQFDEYHAVCEPGTEEPCYSGPAVTEGVGPCKAGVQTCNLDGTGYGACAGEVVPQQEDCATSADEDCDGETLDADAGCVCEPGTGEACYSGPVGTEGVGACKVGIHTCDAAGTSYGVCAEQVVPQVEQCGTLAVDENCDAEPQCTGAHRRSKRFGDAADQYTTNVAVDAAGNVVVAGYFNGSVDFGGGTLGSAGNHDIFVAKVDPQLGHLVSQRFGDTDYQSPTSVAVDAAGNVVVAGYFNGSVDFGGGTLGSAGNSDIFVAKLDPQLGHLVSQRFGDADSQVAKSVAVDAAGNVVMAGYFAGSVTFGGGTLTSAGSSDIFVAKLDPQLGHLVSQRFGGAINQSATSVAVDAAGNVVLAGEFDGSVDFGGGPLSSAGDSDIFVAKLDPQLGHLWSRRFGDADSQVAASVAVDAAGNVVMAGYFNGSVDFGGGPLGSAGGSDIFVAKLNPQLDHLWSRRFGDATDQVVRSVVVDAAGNVMLGGNFLGSVDFGGGPLSSAGGSDIFVAKLNPQLGHLWSRRFGDTAFQVATSVAADAAGNVVLGGNFSGSVDFGEDPLPSAGVLDIFVAKLAP